MPALPEVLARLKNLFDLSARPDVIAAHLSVDSRLARVVARCPGLRVPGAFDGFELAVRAILGQRISVRAATTLAGRLADRFGEPIETPVPGLTRLSPTPERLAAVDEADLTSLGIAAPRAASIRAIARAVASREIDLEPGPDPEAVIGKAPGASRDRRLDGPVYRHACLALAQRLPRRRPGIAQGVGRNVGATSARRVGGLAPLARLRSHLPLGKPTHHPSGEPR